MSNDVEKIIRQGMTAARWLLAPMYLGLVLLLLVLLILFIKDFFRFLPELFQMESRAAVAHILRFVEVILVASILLMILRTGSALFTPNAGGQPGADGHPTRFDFALMKTRFLSALIVVAATALIRTLLEATATGSQDIPADLTWISAVFALLVLSFLVLSIADWFTSLAAARRAVRKE